MVRRIYSISLHGHIAHIEVVGNFDDAAEIHCLLTTFQINGPGVSAVGVNKRDGHYLKATLLEDWPRRFTIIVPSDIVAQVRGIMK
jgi:hypothetical protein